MTRRYRRRGLSRQELLFATERACMNILLWSGEQRRAAQALYRAVGFNSGIETGFVLTRPSPVSTKPLEA
ncbi:hypothetical protein [Gilvimarinus algae]|uniref:N-acetyltransferase domain-containing protein n=1 Tax=Gilvimarinus algae TaxID=3058037 RepID=A0ABT8TEN4_9GAMM|nr:hypothetical protein [Gilvimarinus sp. SDUM040014]MDO3381538.1 hypothetical protein [Gilvimarinus sp. SDUM040014]